MGRRISPELNGNTQIGNRQRIDHVRSRGATRVPVDRGKRDLINNLMSVGHNLGKTAVQVAAYQEKKLEQEGIQEALSATDEELNEAFKQNPEGVRELAFQKQAGVRLGQMEGAKLQQEYLSDFNSSDMSFEEFIDTKRASFQDKYKGNASAGFWKQYNVYEQNIQRQHGDKEIAFKNKQKSLNIASSLQAAVELADSESLDIGAALQEQLKDNAKILGVREEEQAEHLLPIAKSLAEAGKVSELEELLDTELGKNRMAFKTHPDFIVKSQQLKKLGESVMLENISRQSIHDVIALEVEASTKGLSPESHDKIRYLLDEKIISPEKYRSIAHLDNNYRQAQEAGKKGIERNFKFNDYLEIAKETGFTEKQNARLKSMVKNGDLTNTQYNSLMISSRTTQEEQKERLKKLQQSNSLAYFKSTVKSRELNKDEQKILANKRDTGSIKVSAYTDIMTASMTAGNKRRQQEQQKLIEEKGRPGDIHIRKNLKTVTTKDILQHHENNSGYYTNKQVVSLIVQAHKAKNKKLSGNEKKQLERMYVSGLLKAAEEGSLNRTVLKSFITEVKDKTGFELFNNKSGQALKMLGEVYEERKFSEFNQATKELDESASKLGMNPNEVREKRRELRLKLDADVLEFHNKNGLVSERIRGSLNDGASSYITPKAMEDLESGNDESVPMSFIDGFDLYRRLKRQDNLQGYLDEESEELYEIFDELQSIGVSRSESLFAAMNYRTNKRNGLYKVPTKEIQKAAQSITWTEKGWLWDSEIEGNFHNQEEVNKTVGKALSLFVNGAGYSVERAKEMVIDKISRNYSTINGRFTKTGQIRSPEALESFAYDYLPNIAKRLKNTLYEGLSSEDLSFKFVGDGFQIVVARTGEPIQFSDKRMGYVSANDINQISRGRSLASTLEDIEDKEGRLEVFAKYSSEMQAIVYKYIDSDIKPSLVKIMEETKKKEEEEKSLAGK